jgi:hypothetical protein
MNHHGHDKNTDMAIATQSFANEYQKRHPYVSPGAVRVVVELSRLSAVVNAEDAPLGSLELLSDADRERRAKLVGKRLGAKKDAIK